MATLLAWIVIALIILSLVFNTIDFVLQSRKNKYIQRSVTYAKELIENLEYLNSSQAQRINQLAEENSNLKAEKIMSAKLLKDAYDKIDSIDWNKQ